MDRYHIVICHHLDHIDLGRCEEYLVSDDAMDRFDPYICLTLYIYRALDMYLCYDPIFYMIPIGYLDYLSDPQMIHTDISSTIDEWIDTDRVHEWDDRYKK
jgi:hypothetical protein